MRKSFDLYQIDAFIIKNVLFTGNPASVCVLQNDDDINDETKQKIASEVNQSMTAFVSHKWYKSEKCIETNGMNSSYKIRFFTPTQELPLCGHATVATSHLLSSSIAKDNGFKIINYETKFNETMTALIDANELITLSMPINIPKTLSCYENWIKNIAVSTIGCHLYPSMVDEIALSSKFFLICLIDSEENNTYKANPDFEKLRTIERKGLTNGLIVTQKANFDKEGVHFFSRVFLTWIGVDEDPVCGSAHTVLTPYWKQRLSIDGQLIGKQCSKRGGLLKCFQNEDRIELSGNARIIYNGKIYL